MEAVLSFQMYSSRRRKNSEKTECDINTKKEEKKKVMHVVARRSVTQLQGMVCIFSVSSLLLLGLCWCLLTLCRVTASKTVFCTFEPLRLSCFQTMATKNSQFSLQNIHYPQISRLFFILMTIVIAVSNEGIKTTYEHTCSYIGNNKSVNTLV